MKYLKLSLSIAGFTVLLSTFLLFKPQIRSVMASNHLLPEPDNLTELYFVNHLSLPKIIVPKGVNSFVFTVTNLENKPLSYPYEVSILVGDVRSVLDRGVITLKNNESRSVKENFISVKNLRTRIIVELKNRNQQISFWMNPAI